jgi:hypothetical protein
MRSLLPLLIGLCLGIVGATLFVRSLPPQPGSAEEKAEKLEIELRRTQNRLASLEAADPNRFRRHGRTLADGARGIAEDLRDGRPVDLDDIFQAAKPLLKDLGPIFGRIRERDQKRHFDTLIGEYSRRYHLDENQQKKFKDWLEAKARSDALEFGALMGRDGTSLEDMIRASRKFRPTDDLDAFMETTLSGEPLNQFKSDRMADRVDRVQQEADRKVHRLDEIVGLDEAQKDRVFSLMARGSRDFDSSMRFDGLSEEATALAPGSSREEAILAELRPEQQQAYQDHRRQRRQEAEEELGVLGINLPENWDLLDGDDWIDE